MSDNLKTVVDYLYDNYHKDGERMMNIKMIHVLASSKEVHDIPKLIDKIAYFNQIGKSYPEATK